MINLSLPCCVLNSQILSEIPVVHVLKAVAIVTSQHLILSTIFVISHLLIAKMSPEWRLNLGLGTQKQCPFPLNRGVPRTEVTNTKIMWTFFSGPNFEEVSLEQRCPKGEVPVYHQQVTTMQS